MPPKPPPRKRRRSSEDEQWDEAEEAVAAEAEQQGEPMELSQEEPSQEQCVVMRKSLLFTSVHEAETFICSEGSELWLNYSMSLINHPIADAQLGSAGGCLFRIKGGILRVRPWRGRR